MSNRVFVLLLCSVMLGCLADRPIRDPSAEGAPSPDAQDLDAHAGNDGSSVDSQVGPTDIGVTVDGSDGFADGSDGFVDGSADGSDGFADGSADAEAGHPSDAAPPLDAAPDQSDLAPPDAAICAPERCNARDDDCDGQVDEDADCYIVDITAFERPNKFCAVLGSGEVKCWPSHPGDDPERIGDNLPAERIDGHVVQFDRECVLLNDGRIWCSSEDQAQFFGLETAEPNASGFVPLPEPTRQMASQNCALSVTGAVRCWGIASSGVRTDNPIGDAPGEISGLAPLDLGAPAVEIVGTSHVCALLTTGAVRCWGNNRSGQLGFEGDGAVAADVPPLDLGGVRAERVFAQLGTTCVSLENGEVRCWGDLTDIPAEWLEPQDPPLRVLRWTSESACAIDVAGQVHCKSADRGIPVPDGHVPLGEDLRAVDVVPASRSACARLEDGRAKCWGSHLEGQLLLGQGQLFIRGDAPQAELSHLDLGMGSVVQLVVGRNHSCAVNLANQVKCWGANHAGQLGVGDFRKRGDDPEELGAALPFVQILWGLADRLERLRLGVYQSCAISNQGTLSCWGKGFGPRPVRIDTGDRRVRDVALGNRTSCILFENGEVLCSSNELQRAFRRGADGQLRAPVPLGGIAVDIAAGTQHVCAVLEGGAVKCWGRNQSGQLGQGDTRYRPVGEIAEMPPVDLPAPALRVYAAMSKTCALLTDETVRCWGRTGWWPVRLVGENPGEMGAALPVTADARGIESLSIGASGLCLLQDNRLRCVDDGGLTVPLARERAQPAVRAVGRGDYHVCALTAEGVVTCWGKNARGQIGLEKHSALGDDPGELGDALPFINLGSP